MYYYIGIDISKATINVHIATNKQDLVYDNSIKGFKSLYSKLNPIYKQSGSSLQSKYSISKTGSKLYRGILFMGIISAVRFDENFKAFYERLLVNHKHTTQAQIAVMRKVIIIAHSLYRNNKKYDKNYG